MPRLAGGTFGQSYLINLADEKTKENSDRQNLDNETSPTSSDDSFPPYQSQSSSPGILRTPRLRQESMELPSTVNETDTGTPQKSPNRIKLRAAESPSSSTSILTPRSPLRGGRKNATELPSLTTTHAVSDGDTNSTPASVSKRIWRAAESGNSAVLPEYTTAPTSNSRRRRYPPSQRGAPDRFQTRSTPSLRKIVMQGRIGDSSPTLPRTQHDTRKAPPVIPTRRQSLGVGTTALRRRTMSYVTSDDEDTLYSRRSRDRDNYESPYRFRGGRKGLRLHWQKLSNVRIGHILQFVIILAVTLLVYESHVKAVIAVDQLTKGKDEESLLLMHMQQLEQLSIQLHENVARLAQSGVTESTKEDVEDEDKNANVDTALINEQTQTLYQMEEKLNHEVKSLQTKIQQSARNHIIDEFGEGPVQVVLDVDFGGDEDGGGADQITILLWHDTPHAAWTLLEQIKRKIWDGASFDWEQSYAIDLIPSKQDLRGGHIEFIESSVHGHEPWTVGLKESDDGELQMYFNLQDNVNLLKHNVCVGKVIDGFDALQKLLETSRNRNKDDDALVTIKSASAGHRTKTGTP